MYLYIYNPEMGSKSEKNGFWVSAFRPKIDQFLGENADTQIPFFSDFDSIYGLYTY